jgi:hypothetical protein
LVGVKTEDERGLARNRLERPDVRDFRGDINASTEMARGRDGFQGCSVAERYFLTLMFPTFRLRAST